MTNNFNTAELTKEQLECVNYNAGDLLVRGVAGSGKSYVIVKRAIKVNSEKEANEKVGLLTFAKTLVKYTDDTIVNAIGENTLYIQNVDKLCYDMYEDVMHKKFWGKNDNYYTKAVEDTFILYKQAHKVFPNHRFFKMDKEFFKDEFKWIREKCIKTRQEYLAADRKGRGAQVHLNQNDKELLWDIYEYYPAAARANKYQDLTDLYVQLNDKISSIPEKYKFDYLFIDEAQDLTVAKMKVLKAITKKSITIAADVAQKIYKTSFTWKEVGIDVSGRKSKALTKSFRSTKQIVTLAEDVMSNNRADEANDEYTEAVMPEAEGPVPKLTKFQSEDEEKAYLVTLLRGLLNKDTTVGILMRTNYELKKMKDFLTKNKISSEIVDKDGDFNLYKPGVKLVTVYSAKGLEFDEVIIPYFNDNLYPYKIYNTEPSAVDSYLQTERSILYVAMTRARKGLFFTCQLLSASRFVDEFKKDHYEVG